ncbi:DNA replication/repair protein RecF [Thiomicrorhabdus aquaedulcis]|uniref:DNA replication/repair protein RecF n=1 Tax=Thiomicrorhabdus aquaedulcis TaxID=2211106 RepID=UPI000FDB5EFF|nr:DNA replication/repair protein RecF [Thiomicrorhabdus aquaedulcis]
MTHITQLTVQQFRNCHQANLSLSPGLNLIVGDNAAGKTSLIEAIWVLATGRSFRTAKPQQLIEHTQTDCTVFAAVSSSFSTSSHHNPSKTHRLGLQKSALNTTLRVDGETTQSQAELARLLPVQLLTPESHRLLEEGPKARRQFMDWGCFHQHPEFAGVWRTYQRALKQRNHALKRRLPKAQIQLWDSAVVDNALAIDAIRQDYLAQLTPYLLTFCQALMPELTTTVQCQYRAGWSKGCDNLLGLFEQSFDADLRMGHTQFGAHRADIRFKFGAAEALDTLSRGQQKLFVCALLLAQASLHEKVVQEPIIMLIDDLPAELDATHRLKLLELLQILNIQHIITSTAQSLIPILNPDTTQIWSLHDGAIV